MKQEEPTAWQSELSWLWRIPKVELHLHLEGAIPYPALWELVQKYGGDSTVPYIEALKQKFVYRDFPHFLETWRWKNQFLREYDDFEFFAEAVAHDLARQNIRYAEAFFSPGDFARHGLETQRLVEAVRSGIDRVWEVKVALVADLVRDFGPDRGATTLAEVSEVRDLGVIGIGIGGSEHEVPPEVFSGVYQQARKFGFFTSAHAGEAAGPESVWGAILALYVDRIGHGTRAAEDESLVEYLAKHRIPLELCPISNLCTGVVDRIEAHPVRQYFERGIPLSINTDDPKMFGNSLAEEYLLLEQRLGFSRNDVRTLIEQAVETSWLPGARKRQLIDDFRRDPLWFETIQ